MILIENLLIDEKYFTYYDGTAARFRATFEVYKNPTESELSKFIDTRARGFIDTKGNLYLVGWDEDEYEFVKDFKHPLHAHLLLAIYDKDPSLFTDSSTSFAQYTNFEKPEWISKNGVPVEYIQESKTIYVGEFLSMTKRIPSDAKLVGAISGIYDKAKKVNPHFKYAMGFSPFAMKTTGFEKNKFMF